MNKTLSLLLSGTFACAAAACGASDDAGLAGEGTDAERAAATSVSGMFTPPAGTTLLIAGQTTDGLRNYKASFQEPGGVTFYVNPMLQSTGPGMRGAPDWYKTGYGDEDLDYINREFPNSALAVGVWMGQAIESDIAYDESIQKTYLDGPDSGAQMKANLGALVDTLKATNRPVFLRLGYEAEGQWNGYYPDAYKKVWRYVRELIQQKGATNIAMVWQIAAWCSPNGDGAPFMAYFPRDASSMYPGLDQPWHDAQIRSREASGPVWDDWYPGGDQVDWVAFSYFDQWKVCNSNGKSGNAKLQEAVDYLKSKGKPIMVAESSPRGFDLRSGSLFVDQLGYRESGLSGQQVWDAWYAPFFDFVSKNNDGIRAVAYINDNWEAYSHWRCDPNNLASCAEGYWGDAQLTDNPTVAERWRETVERSGKFLLGGRGMFDAMGCWNTRDNPSTCRAVAGGGGGPGGGGDSGPGAGFSFCANEGGQCSFSGTKIVAYGASGVYTEKTLTDGTACTNAVFGDPIVGVVKACYVKDAPSGGSGESGGTGGTGGATASVPGVVAAGVGSVADGQVLTYAIELASAKSVSFRLSGTSPQSQLITTSVDGASQTNATTGVSGGVIITSPAFDLSPGRHTLSFKIQGNGISISEIEAL